MLGYIRTVPPELKVREQEYYRALYCGLCKHMGKCTGQCSRMTLSYDFVFLAAVRMALTEEKVTLTRKRCLLHPFRPRPMAVNSPTLSYCAHASALLVYHKLMDDLADERGFKKVRALLSRPFLRSAYRRAKKQYPNLDGAIGEYLRELARIEEDLAAPPSADRPALCFGKLMEAVFAEGLTDTNARISGAIGRAVGRWIYLIDAADDFAEDRKKDRFNPYLRLFEGDPSPENWETVELALTALLGEAERAYLLMDPYPSPDVQGILANLLYLGLPQTAKKIIQKNITAERDKRQ